MNKIINIYKPAGMTPLQLIHAVKEKYPEFKNQKIGYAGRLDPLAHGVMLLMVEDATREREKYLGLDKMYEFEVLFGLETDTFDLLGLVKETHPSEEIVREKVRLFVNKYKKKKTHVYPPYSSKTVQGKPLFWWARNNKLSEIVIPERAIEIMDFDVLSFKELSKSALQKKVNGTLEVVNGDFRQKEISEAWETFFRNNKKEIFQTASFRLHCSSGTYVRGFVHELGNYLGCGAVTLDILRTQVGTFTLDTSLRL